MIPSTVSAIRHYVLCTVLSFPNLTVSASAAGKIPCLLLSATSVNTFNNPLSCWVLAIQGSVLWESDAQLDPPDYTVSTPATGIVNGDVWPPMSRIANSVVSLRKKVKIQSIPAIFVPIIMLLLRTYLLHICKTAVCKKRSPLTCKIQESTVLENLNANKSYLSITF